MNPVEGWIRLGVEAFRLKRRDTSFRGRQIRVEFVVGVLGRMDVRDRALVGVWIRCYSDFIVKGVPMRALEEKTFSTYVQSHRHGEIRKFG